VGFTAVSRAASWAWVTLLTFGCSRNESTTAQAAPTASTHITAQLAAGVATNTPQPAAAPATRSIAAKPSSLCEKVCERTRDLRCKDHHGCLANCTMMAAMQPCDEQFAAFYGCLAQETLSHWECSPEGVPAIRDGYCEKEQAAASSCLEHQVDQ
jgi:hypothetical protein